MQFFFFMFLFSIFYFYLNLLHKCSYLLTLKVFTCFVLTWIFYLHQSSEIPIVLHTQSQPDPTYTNSSTVLHPSGQAFFTLIFYFFATLAWAFKQDACWVSAKGRLCEDGREKTQATIHPFHKGRDKKSSFSDLNMKRKKYA